MGIEVNNRVRCIRIVMAELGRIASHLIAAGTYGNDIGSFTPFLWCFRDRERILDMLRKPAVRGCSTTTTGSAA